MDSRAPGHRSEFITANNSGIFICGAKANYCLESNQMSWTANTSLLSRIIPPLQFHKFHHFPLICKNTTKENRNFLRAEVSIRGLGGPRKEVLSVEKLVLELRWGNIFPRKGDKEESHIFMDQLCLSFVVPFTNCFSPLPIPSPTTELHFRVAFSPTFFYPLQYFSHC